MIRLQQAARTGVKQGPTTPAPVSTEGVTDFARARLTGEFPLEGFAPGGYVLRLTVTDRAAIKSVTRRTDFTVE